MKKVLATPVCEGPERGRVTPLYFEPVQDKESQRWT